MSREAYRPVTRKVLARVRSLGGTSYAPGKRDGHRRGGRVIILPDGTTYSTRDIEIAQRRESYYARADKEERGQLTIPGTNPCPWCAGRHLIEPTGLSVCVECLYRYIQTEEINIRNFILHYGIVPGPLFGRQGDWCPNCYPDGNLRLQPQDPYCPECAIKRWKEVQHELEQYPW